MAVDLLKKYTHVGSVTILSENFSFGENLMACVQRYLIIEVSDTTKAS